MVSWLKEQMFQLLCFCLYAFHLGLSSKWDRYWQPRL